jgi:hypothetical protein
MSAVPGSVVCTVAPESLFLKVYGGMSGVRAVGVADTDVQGQRRRVVADVRRVVAGRARRSTVDVPAVGLFDPSLVRDTGSRPVLSTKRLCGFAGVSVQPASGLWQVTHARPFVPRL